MIRPITIDELSAVEDAARDFYAASRFLGGFRIERFCETWAALLATGAGVIFAALDGAEDGIDPAEDPGAVAGVIGGLLHREIYGEALIAEEFFWFCRPERRGAGVALYRRFEQWARERGAATIQMVHLLDVMPEKVARFYLRSGFEPVEMRYVKALSEGAIKPKVESGKAAA
jgi:GNAT superfamily N-acetyltransferase